MRITFFVTLLYFISITAFAQTQNEDSIKVIKPFDSFIIKNTAYLTDSSNAFKYSEYIWSDKRSISEVMDQRPGYFVFDFFGLGGRNAITNSSILPYGISAFRDGIQINDIVYGGFDVEIFSINEVEAVEEISATRSMLFGINSIGRSFNVITKNYFTPLPFSQLRFSQDRANSLSADVFYSQAFSKKFALQIGVTNHSLDGRFENSAFRTWKTRTRLSFNPNDRLNINGNFYYNYIERGLNGGVSQDVISIDSLLSGDANVRYTDRSEENEHLYFDINLFGRFFSDENSLTKLNIYSQNTLRKFISTPAGSNNTFINSTHLIKYGINSLQNFRIAHSHNTYSDLIFGIDYQTNRLSRYIEDLNIFTAKAAYDFNWSFLSTSALYRYDRINDLDFSSFGVEASLNFKFTEKLKSKLFAGLKKVSPGFAGYSLMPIPFVSISQFDTYFFERGIDIIYEDLIMKFYVNNYSKEFIVNEIVGYNLALSYKPDWLNVNVTYQYSYDDFFPKNYLKGDIAYIGEFFDNNLKLKTGFEFKYYNIEYEVRYLDFYNLYELTNSTFPQPNQFLADFYIGARIGNANINLTVANIFNSLVYNAYIYPLDNRGGLLNAISRFTIVWDFLN